MHVFTSTVVIETEGLDSIVDISGHAARAVAESRISTGSVLLHACHSTCAITTMEFEPGAVEDLRAWLGSKIPEDVSYRHNELNHDTNAHSHLRAAILGPSVTLPVDGGELVLGTWQTPVLIDSDDRPRRRQIVIQVIGE